MYISIALAKRLRCGICLANKTIRSKIGWKVEFWALAIAMMKKSREKRWSRNGWIRTECTGWQRMTDMFIFHYKKKTFFWIVEIWLEKTIFAFSFCLFSCSFSKLRPYRWLFQKCVVLKSSLNPRWIERRPMWPHSGRFGQIWCSHL